MACDWKLGQDEIKEKSKSDEIGWFSWDELSMPLFLPIQNLLKRSFDTVCKNL